MNGRSLYGVNILKNSDGTRSHEFTFLCEVTLKEEKNIREKLGEIRKFHNLVYRTKNIRNAIDDINKLIDRPDREVESKMAKLISDCLGEIRAYQDRTAHFLNENFPRGADVFKEAKSYEYDTQFCYRYLYHLRNYLQHCGDIPYSNIESYYEDDKPVIKFFMKNESFIKLFPSMNAKLREELSLDIEGKVDIVEQLRNIEKSILNIHDKVVNACIDYKLYETMVSIYRYKTEYPEYEDILMTERISSSNIKLNGMEYFYIGFIEMMIKNIKISITNT